jgi:hypothetical protein
MMYGETCENYVNFEFKTAADFGEMSCGDDVQCNTIVLAVIVFVI